MRSTSKTGPRTKRLHRMARTASPTWSLRAPFGSIPQTWNTDPSGGANAMNLWELGALNQTLHGQRARPDFPQQTQCCCEQPRAFDPAGPQAGPGSQRELSEQRRAQCPNRSMCSRSRGEA